MKQQRMKKMVLLCGVTLGILTAFVQEFKITVCAEEYEYDELNRVIKVIYEDGGTVEYVYDKNGNIVETIVRPIISEDEKPGTVVEPGENDESGETGGQVTDTGSAEGNEPGDFTESAEGNEPASPTDNTEPATPDKPLGANGGTQPNKPTGSNEGTQPGNPAGATESVKPEQSKNVDKIVENLSYRVKNIVQPIIYIENLVQRITEFAKNSFDN